MKEDARIMLISLLFVLAGWICSHVPCFLLMQSLCDAANKAMAATTHSTGKTITLDMAVSTGQPNPQSAKLFVTQCTTLLGPGHDIDCCLVDAPPFMVAPWQVNWHTQSSV